MKKSIFTSLIAIVVITTQSFGQTVAVVKKTPVANNQKTLVSNALLVEGIPVSSENANISTSSKLTDLIYIIAGCCCVQLPCTGCGDPDAKPPIMFGIRKGDILKTVSSGKKTSKGKQATAFYIRKGAVIQGPVMTLVGKNKMAKLDPGKIKGPVGHGHPSSGSVAFIIDDLIESFSAGWAIGTAIDQTFGISDWLSDLWIDAF